MTDLNKEEQVAVRAARGAAEIIQRHAGGMASGTVRFKGTHDLVTDVDVAAQEHIVSVLLDAFPNYEILAEEDQSGTYSESADQRWIIDPIDGTTNFAHGVPPYGVSIALERDGELVLGVVLDVPRDELFTARQGHGLFVNGVRAGVSGTKSLDESLITTGFPYRAFERIDEYLASLRNLMQHTRGIRRPGSASIDLAYVAAGRFDSFFETHLGAWDVAAGIVLVREGGGRVTGFDESIDPLSGIEILATNGHIHDAMLDQLEPLRQNRR